MKFVNVKSHGSAIVLEDINNSVVTINADNKAELAAFFSRFKDSLDEIYELVVQQKASESESGNERFIQLLKKRKLEVDSEKLAHALMLFDRAVFDAPFFTEEPSAMFDAIRKTRVNIQQSGIMYIHELDIAQRFVQIRNILFTCETFIQRQYPLVEQLAMQLMNRPSDYGRRSFVQKKMGPQHFSKAVIEMISIREAINKELEVIRRRYSEMTNQIRSLDF